MSPLWLPPPSTFAGVFCWSPCCLCPLHRFKRILVLISHSQDFLNGVCTNIINLHQRKLKYYTVGDWALLCLGG